MKKSEIKIGDHFHMPVGVVEVIEVGARMVTVKWIFADREHVGKMEHNHILKYPRVRTVDENAQRAHLVARETGN